MASGRSHSIASLTAAACFVTSGAPERAWLAAGAFMGVVVTPDLDHDDGTLSQYFVRGLGHWLERGWWYYWWPYRRLLAHRSFWSHAPIISTVLRLAYLFWWVYALGWTLPPALIVGLCTADILHWLMDWRLFRRVFRREKKSIPNNKNNCFARKNAPA